MPRPLVGEPPLLSLRRPHPELPRRNNHQLRRERRIAEHRKVVQGRIAERGAPATKRGRNEADREVAQGRIAARGSGLFNFCCRALNLGLQGPLDRLPHQIIALALEVAFQQPASPPRAGTRLGDQQRELGHRPQSRSVLVGL
jgi:hypothetical protein